MSAGESHGPALAGIISGIPAGLKISIDLINTQLSLRQDGAGRSQRQNIESDTVEILSGLRNGVTLGSPIALVIENLDHINWHDAMPVEESENFSPRKYKAMPRPGHADLAGMLKWDTDDARNVLERASGRSTAITVALGSICRQMLTNFGIYLGSRIIEYGPELLVDDGDSPKVPTRADFNDPALILALGTLTVEQMRKIEKVVSDARESGNTLGGVVQAVSVHIPPGLGSCMNPDERLDSRIAGAVMAIPGIKAVEIGAGMDQTYIGGKEAQDKFAIASDPFTRPWYSRETNFAGGIEGGITNGEPVCVKAWIKPLSTVDPPFASIDVNSKTPITPENTERSDVAVIEPVAVVIKAVLAMEIARAFLEKFGGDTMDEVTYSFERYMSKLEKI